ncbi:hypothetical protein BD779DRAFT_1536189 [Infundibulicybe gibba]|nr:hypothetical protein BD779DRAFT_1536189 [Infundibulicybe gibba]
MSSTLFALSVAIDDTIVSPYAPDEYERAAYYNGITGYGDGDPELVYRSDFLTTPFPKPEGRFGYIPVKSAYGVFDTPLNNVWDAVGPQIKDLIKSRGVNWSSIDPARFFTHSPEEDQGTTKDGTLGPVVIWVGVIPGSTSADTAHEVSQEILALLLKSGVRDAVLEWREAVPARLAGPPLLPHVGNYNATHHVRRFLTPLLGIPLATEGMEEEGNLTLWFHENQDEDGNPSDKVYGVSSCHVLRRDTTVEYECKGDAHGDHVRVCGVRRFRRGLDEIKKAIRGRGIDAEVCAVRIDRLRAEERQDQRAICAGQRGLEKANRSVASLKALCEEVTKSWSNITDRNIGHVEYAAPITVDVEGGTWYTADWAAFLATGPKVRGGFEGNVIDLGSIERFIIEFSPLFRSLGDDRSTCKFPVDGKLRIVGCVTEEELANPEEFDTEGRRRYIVGKDGNTTDLTVGRYAGLVSFVRNRVGIESVELGIYNSGLKRVEAFSAKGDSGSLVWHLERNENARIVGQLHSGSNRGGTTRNHISYLTPGWYLLDQIRKRFKHADFYRTAW